MDEQILATLASAVRTQSSHLDHAIEAMFSAAERGGPTVASAYLARLDPIVRDAPVETRA